MGGKCGMLGGGEFHTGFWWGELKERERLDDTVVDGKIILNWIRREKDPGEKWIDLTEDRDT